MLSTKPTHKWNYRPTVLLRNLFLFTLSSLQAWVNWISSDHRWIIALYTIIGNTGSDCNQQYWSAFFKSICQLSVCSYQRIHPGPGFSGGCGIPQCSVSGQLYYTTLLDKATHRLELGYLLVLQHVLQHNILHAVYAEDNLLLMWSPIISSIFKWRHASLIRSNNPNASSDTHKCNCKLNHACCRVLKLEPVYSQVQKWDMEEPPIPIKKVLLKETCLFFWHLTFYQTVIVKSLYCSCNWDHRFT